MYNYILENTFVLLLGSLHSFILSSDEVWRVVIKFFLFSLSTFILTNLFHFMGLLVGLNFEKILFLFFLALRMLKFRTSSSICTFLFDVCSISWLGLVDIISSILSHTWLWTFLFRFFSFNNLSLLLEESFVRINFFIIVIVTLIITVTIVVTSVPPLTFLLVGFIFLYGWPFPFELMILIWSIKSWRRALI